MSDRKTPPGPWSVWPRHRLGQGPLYVVARDNPSWYGGSEPCRDGEGRPRSFDTRAEAETAARRLNDGSA